MKYLSKLLSMLLVGAMLCSTACTDYDEDIKNLDQKVDDLKQELLEGQINPLKADLAATKAALEGAIAEANAKVAENKAAIEALKETDKEHDAAIAEANDAIAKAVEDFEKALGTLETKHDADIAAVNAKIAEEAKKATDAINAAVARITENESAIEALQAKDADLVEAIEAAKADIKKNAEAIAKNAHAIAENADAIADNADAIADNKAAIEANAADIEQLEKDLIALTGDFAKYQAATDAAIATLETRVDEAEKAIETLEGNVEELYELHDNQAALIDNLQGQLDALDSFVSEQLDILAETDRALAVLIENLETDLMIFQAQVDEEFTKAYGLIANNTAAINALEAKHDAEVKALQAQDTAILNTLEQHAGWLLDLEEALSALDQRVGAAEGAIGKIQSVLTQLEASIDTLTADLLALQERVDAVKAELEEQIARVDEHVAKALNYALENAQEMANKAEYNAKEFAKAYTDLLQKAVETALADLGAQLDALNAYAVSIEAALDEYKENTNNVLAAMTIDIKELMDRIQSIVYVPTKANHKADVVSLFTYGRKQEEVLVSEGYVEMTFRVTPIDAAQQLVAYFATQNDREMPIFTFETEEVTRVGEKPVCLTINSVREDDVNGNGRFIVNATPSLPAAFYEEEISYSVALRLKKNFSGEVEGNEYSANLVSDYVNLELVKDYINGLVLVGEKDGDEYVVYPDECVEYEIEYADMDARVELLEGLEPRYEYVRDGETYYCSAEDLAALGYNVADLEIECKHTAYTAAKEGDEDDTEVEKLADANFALDTPAESGHDVVKLASEEKATRETIGNHLDTDHAFTIAPGATYDFYSCVKIVKEHRDAALSAITYKWQYTDYKVYVTDNTELYEGAARQFVLEVAKSNIPADILAENGKYVVEGYDADNTEIVAKDAEENKYEGELTVKPIKYEEKDGKGYWTVEVAGWLFDNVDWNYDVTYEFEDIDVKFNFDVKFISLQDLEYVHAPAVEFTYDLSKSYETTLKDAQGKELKLAEVLAEKYPGLVDKNNGHFETIEDLAEGIWYNTGKTANYNTVRTNAEGVEKSVLSKNEEYQSALNSKPWSFLRFYKSSAGMNEMVLKVWGDDVVSDYDTFAMTTDFTTKFQNKTMKVTLESTAIVKMPDIYVVHVPYVVKDNGEVYNDEEVGKSYQYYSEVVGLWDPNNKYESAVKSFTAQDIDLRSGFEVVIKNDKALDGYVVLTQEELDAMKVTFEFELDDDYTESGLGITLDDDTHTVLSYMGWEKFVKANGTLKINGIEKRNAFAEYNDKYAVKKFDPIGEFDVEENAVISTAEATAYYTKNIFEDIQLFDVRGRELIDAKNYVAPVDATDPSVANLAFDADNYTPWVVGNDENGFATDVAVDNVFSLTNIKFDYEVTDKDGRGINFLDKYLDKTQVQYGLFVFSNLNNLKLQDDIFVNVYVTVSYPWCEEKSGVIRFRVTSDVIEETPAE